MFAKCICARGKPQVPALHRSPSPRCVLLTDSPNLTPSAQNSRKPLKGSFFPSYFLQTSLLLFLFFNIYLCIHQHFNYLFVCMHVGLCAWMRVTHGHWFTLYTMLVLVIRLRSSGLVGGKYFCSLSQLGGLNLSDSVINY